MRRYTTPHTLSPRAHLLSNGSYTVMVTNAGGGYSRRQQLALTRWREDITTDAWGSFCYVRDLDSGDVWSTTLPADGRARPTSMRSTFAPDRAVFRRLDAGLETRTEVVVSPEDDAELRRVSITNHSHRARSLDLTSYAEVVLAPGAADLAHPAFSNLFVETRQVPERDALMLHAASALRDRPRLPVSRAQRPRPHRLAQPSTKPIARGSSAAAARWPTRQRCPPAHRCRTRPAPVLDPIVSLRQSIRLPPGGTARARLHDGFADNEADARRLIEKYHDRRAVARAIALASTHAQIELRHLGLTVDDTMRFQRLAGRLMFGDPRLREAEPCSTTVAASPNCGSTASPATCPSSLRRSRTAASCHSSAICSRRTSTCAARVWPSISSS